MTRCVTPIPPSPGPRSSTSLMGSSTSGCVAVCAVSGTRVRVDGTLQDQDHAVWRLWGALCDRDRDQVQLSIRPGRLSNGVMATGIRFAYAGIGLACQEAPARVGERALRGRFL